MTNWIWNPFTGNLDGVCGGSGIKFLLKQKRLIWDTDIDWSQGTLGPDVEIVGTGVAAAIAPKTTIGPGSEIYLTWHLNETEGTTAADSSQYNRPGTLITPEGYSPAQWVAGKLNNAISNPGEFEALDYVEGGDIAGFEYNQPFSVECWFWQAPGYDTSVAGNLNTAESKGWQIFIQEGYLRVLLNGADGNYIQTYSSTAVTPNTWQHLVITYDGSGVAAGIKFYLDGVLLGNNVFYDGLNSASIVPASNNFRIGAVEAGWIGILDEFNLYTVVLSQANVDFRYNAGAGTETPLFTQAFYPTTAQYLTNIADSEIAGQYWGSFNFMRTTPSGTTAVVKCRVSDDANNMGAFGSALVPGAIVGLNGQFIQFSVDFTGTTTVRSVVDLISVLYIAPNIYPGDLINYVPYLGAIDDVDIGSFFFKTTGTITGLLRPLAGTSPAGKAPLQFISGTLLSTPEAGAIEFEIDDYFATITTGEARKAFILDDGTRLVSGRIPYATTNGRLIDSANLTFNGTLLSVPDISAANLTLTNSPTISSLTPGQVLFVGASNELAGDVDLTFSVDTLTSTKVLGSTHVETPIVLTQEIKTDTSTPTDLTITCGSQKTPVLTDTVWKDLWSTVDPARVTGTTNTIMIGNIRELVFSNNDTADFPAVELQHDWKEGTDLIVHMHIATRGTNLSAYNVRYTIDYTWSDVNGVFSGPGTLDVTLNIAGSTTPLSHKFIAVGTISGTGFHIGSQIKFLLTKIAAVSDDTPAANNPYVLQIGVHYQNDTLGSRQIATK